MTLDDSKRVPPVDWTPYDAFDWDSSQQTTMDADQRAALERLAANVLQIDEPTSARRWGFASPPGRFAATAIRVVPGAAHRYAQRAASLGIDDVAVKIYKANADARREFAKVLPLHEGMMNRLPGLPHPHVQKSIAASWVTGPDGLERGVVIQEWKRGETLDAILADHARGLAVDRATARGILEQIFGRIVIPLWNGGLIWWDIRDANWCFDRRANRLSLIDVDSLGAYADEILHSDGAWDRREKGRATALPRLRETAWRVLQTQIPGSATRVKARLKEGWGRLMEPALRGLGATQPIDAALRALAAWLDEMFQAAGD